MHPHWMGFVIMLGSVTVPMSVPERRGSECLISVLHRIGWNLFQMNIAASLHAVRVNVHTHVLGS